MKSSMRSAFIWILALVTAASVSAQRPGLPSGLEGGGSPEPTWRRVRQIPAQQKIKVHLASGTTLSGRFLEADSEGLALLVGGNKTNKAARTEIVRITKKSAGRGALKFGIPLATLGAVLGICAGGYCDDQDGNDAALGPAVGVALVGGLGAAIGALIGHTEQLYP